jgi:hypothetical protein
MTILLPFKLQPIPPAITQNVSIGLQSIEGIPIFQASPQIQERILQLLDKQKAELLSDMESQELDQYEELDDYLSLVNRLVRNLYLNQV